jgi:hypothetical protein
MFMCYLDEYHNTRQHQDMVPTLDQIQNPDVALTTATTTDKDYGIVIRTQTEHHRDVLLLLHFDMLCKLSVTNILLYFTCNLVKEYTVCDL